MYYLYLLNLKLYLTVWSECVQFPLCRQLLSLKRACVDGAFLCQMGMFTGNTNDAECTGSCSFRKFVRVTLRNPHDIESIRLEQVWPTRRSIYEY